MSGNGDNNQSTSTAPVEESAGFNAQPMSMQAEDQAKLLSKGSSLSEEDIAMARETIAQRAKDAYGTAIMSGASPEEAYKEAIKAASNSPVHPDILNNAALVQQSVETGAGQPPASTQQEGQSYQEFMNGKEDKNEAGFGLGGLLGGAGLFGAAGATAASAQTAENFFGSPNESQLAATGEVRRENPMAQYYPHIAANPNLKDVSLSGVTDVGYPQGSVPDAGELAANAQRAQAASLSSGMSVHVAEAKAAEAARGGRSLASA